MRRWSLGSALDREGPLDGDGLPIRESFVMGLEKNLESQNRVETHAWWNDHSRTEG